MRWVVLFAVLLAVACCCEHGARDVLASDPVGWHAGTSPLVCTPFELPFGKIPDQEDKDRWCGCHPAFLTPDETPTQNNSLSDQAWEAYEQSGFFGKLILRSDSAYIILPIEQCDWWKVYVFARGSADIYVVHQVSLRRYTHWALDGLDWSCPAMERFNTSSLWQEALRDWDMHPTDAGFLCSAYTLMIAIPHEDAMTVYKFARDGDQVFATDRRNFSKTFGWDLEWPGDPETGCHSVWTKQWFWQRMFS